MDSPCAIPHQKVSAEAQARLEASKATLAPAAAAPVEVVEPAAPAPALPEVAVVPEVKGAQERLLSNEDVLRLIDTYLLQFEKALQEGRVRFDNPADFATMVRLREFLYGRADSRKDVHNPFSLEALQERHAQMLREAREATPEMAGYIDIDGQESNSEEAPED